METQVFVLCDAAADYSGRLSVLGIFDTIFAQQLPAVHPQCAVALRIRFDKIEEGKHVLALHIINQDGGLVVPPLNGEFNIQIGEGERSGVVNLIMNLQSIPFDRYGIYEVKVAIDNLQVSSCPFFVRQPIE